MTARVQSRRTRAEAVAVESDGWVWSVILSIAALSALSVATVFSVAIG